MSCGCGDNENVASGTQEPERPAARPQIVGYRVSLLIAAGAAMVANCEPCLKKLVPDLIEAGVSMADIRAAVTLGQTVKDRPAGIMKELADALTGTILSGGPAEDGCPLEEMKRKEQEVAAEARVCSRLPARCGSEARSFWREPR